MIAPQDRPSQDRLRALIPAARELAHELKNHLHVALGSMDYLPAALEGERAQRDLARAMSSLERMDALISRCQVLLRGGGEQPTPVDLHRFLAELVDDMRPLTEPRGRHFEVTRQGELGQVLVLREELLGFLSSVLAGAGGKRIGLELSPMRLEGDSVLPDGAYVGLRIKAGFPETARWSCVAEVLTIRAAGGDLRQMGEDWVIVLPQA
ncbi:MAG: hypothetical protein ACE5F1_18445 [Planctomycetota bacterium]